MRRAIAFLAVVVVALTTACSDGGGTVTTPPSTSGQTTTLAAAPAYQPLFAEAGCVDEVPPSDRIDCGWLTVPEDRADPTGTAVKLPVAIIRSADPQPEPDPVIYFSGGPGFPGLTIADYFLDHDFGPRDIILFDQRGTGKAEPSLDCTENVETVWATLGAARPIDDEVADAQDAFAACRDRLVAAGVNLDAYNTSATAADVADLRNALGIDQWNLYGISYGTTVALAVLREHPEGVRSAVIDSVYPPTVGFGGAAVVAAAQRVFDVFYAGCAADPDCAAGYPTLEDDVLALAADFDANPYEADVPDRATGGTRHLVLTGSDAVAGIWNAFYDTSLIGVLPSIIAPLRERGAAAEAIIEQFATLGLDQLTGAAEGETLSVDCADRQRIDTLAGLDAALSEHPELEGVATLSPIRQTCEAWSTASLPETFNDPVESDVPTLVLAGEYDPITPPADSKAAADALGHATFVQFPGMGHGVSTADDCPHAIVQAFVVDPSATVNTSCLAQMGGPEWALPGP